MTILSKPLRRQLETAIRQAREIAESAANEAISRIGVADAEAPSHLSEDNKALRRRLRAHGRTLGDTRDAAGAMTTSRLQDAAAYEIWHRMLFGRFLVERGLLIHPDLGAAISVAELRELAQEEGSADEWALAERYAAPGLPGVFKPDDPVLSLPIAPEFSQRLRAVLSGLPEDVFDADDSLGWTYQFWRASEKDAVNQAGGKIGATELPAVTQLFTESYMVKFLLQNTLGAWWAGKVLASDPALASDAADEDALRDACALPGATWEFLRFVRDDDGKGPWRPAAGTFHGWPTRAAEVTYCDPCCGSGHFLVEALGIIAALRRKEEGLSAGEAAVAVLRDNLHGLEIDGRCVQIAAFNVALAAWKLAGFPTPLPSPHIAWVGAPPPMGRPEMAALGNGDITLRHALEMLHDQFAQAPSLGSLLEIGARDLLDADLRDRGEAALAKLHGTEPERSEGAVAARGLLDASGLLGRRYVLLATNVPFLGRGKQDVKLATHIAKYYPKSKADLATAMLDRMRRMVTSGGSMASVMPQGWLTQPSYSEFRDMMRHQSRWHLLLRLGEHAFQSSAAAGAFVVLFVASMKKPGPDSDEFLFVDGSEPKDSQLKSDLVRHASLLKYDLKRNFNPATGVFEPGGVPDAHSVRLSEIATSSHGLGTFDSYRFTQSFWEQRQFRDVWMLQQSTPDGTAMFSGCTEVLRWENGCGSLFEMMEEKKKEGYSSGKWKAGTSCWGRRGVLVSLMRSLPATIYLGKAFDPNAAAIIPSNDGDIGALWKLCESGLLHDEVRKVHQAIYVPPHTFLGVSANLHHWQQVAAMEYPHGMPLPYSDDPTQWLFHGHPAFAVSGTELHVALARIAGYQWPAETDAALSLADLAKERSQLAAALSVSDEDGLLPLHANGADLPLADRMRAMLAAAYGAPLPLNREQALVRSADSRLDKKEAKDATLEGWLADRAFRQHCILFHLRPFLWHVWDGMKDGFSAFLHYHRLDRAALDKLTYTVLGDWIRTAKANGQTARVERAERLQQTLAKIIEGENPFDIFVRWKPLARQPMGWEPDLDDGVRLNIRPFMNAGVLREQPKGISWNKDRGTDVPSAPWFNFGPSYGGKNGDRINDHHTTLAEKRAARGTP